MLEPAVTIHVQKIYATKIKPLSCLTYVNIFGLVCSSNHFLQNFAAGNSDDEVALPRYLAKPIRKKANIPTDATATVVSDIFLFVTPGIL